MANTDAAAGDDPSPRQWTHVGARRPRAAARRHVAGHGNFVDDIDLPRMAHAAFLRSPHAHARIRAIDVRQAKAMSGVVVVLTGNDLARHVTRGDFDPADFHDQSDEEVMAALVQVWGIGEWSAQMHLMFSLGRLDVWPVLDLGVRNGWAKFQGGAPPTVKGLIPLGERYRPYRSVVAWYMWRVHDVEDWS